MNFARRFFLKYINILSSKNLSEAFYKLLIFNALFQLSVFQVIFRLFNKDCIHLLQFLYLCILILNFLEQVLDIVGLAVWDMYFCFKISQISLAILVRANKQKVLNILFEVPRQFLLKAITTSALRTLMTSLFQVTHAAITDCNFTFQTFITIICV